MGRGCRGVGGQYRETPTWWGHLRKTLILNLTLPFRNSKPLKRKIVKDLEAFTTVRAGGGGFWVGAVGGRGGNLLSHRPNRGVYE